MMELNDDDDDDDNNNNNNNNNTFTLKPIEDHDHQSTAVPNAICPQTEVEDLQASLGVTCCQHVESPVAFGLLDKDCRFKSVVIIVPNFAGFA